jgi:hypothetical protein
MAQGAMPSLADIERKMRESGASVPQALVKPAPPLTRRSMPPGLLIPPSEVAVVESTRAETVENKDAGAKATEAEDEADKDEGEEEEEEEEEEVDAAVLEQIRQAQGQNLMQQRFQVEQQRFGAHMQQLAEQMKISQDHIMINRAQAAKANQALLQLGAAMAQAGAAPPPEMVAQRQQLEEQRGTSTNVAHEHQRRCQEIGRAQAAAQGEFYSRQTTIAIETGNAKLYRGMLEGQSGQLKAGIQKTLADFSHGATLLHNLESRHRETAMKLSAVPAAQQEGTRQLLHGIEQQLAQLANHQRAIQQQQTALATQEQHVCLQMKTLEEAFTDKGNTEYNNLMSESEKSWLISIQRKQMHSDNPYVDNFYYEALHRKRAADMRRGASNGTAGGGGGDGNGGGGATGANQRGFMPKKLGAPKKEGNVHTPVAFAETLGKLRATNIRAPQQIIQTPIRRDVVDEPDDGSQISRMLQEKARRRQALLTIESAYRQMLIVEDLEYKLEHHGRLSHRARQSIESERATAIEKAFKLLQVPTEGNDDSHFCRILSVNKGKTLVLRLAPWFSPTHKHAVLLSLVRTVDTLVGPGRAGKLPLSSEQAEHLGGLEHFLVPTVQHTLNAMSVAMLTGCLQQAIVSCSTAERCDGMLHEYGATILYSICRCADLLLSGGKVPGADQAEWMSAIAALAQTLVGGLERALHRQSSGTGLLWELTSLLAAHSDAPTRALLKAKLASLAPGEVGKRPPAVQAFLKTVGVAESR